MESNERKKKSLESGLETDRLIFKSLRNKVIRQLRKSKANFFLDVIKQAMGIIKHSGNAKISCLEGSQLNP